MQGFWERVGACWEQIGAWDNAVTSFLRTLFRKRHARAWLVTVLGVPPILLLALALMEGVQARATTWEAAQEAANQAQANQAQAGSSPAAGNSLHRAEQTSGGESATSANTGRAARRRPPFHAAPRLGQRDGRLGQAGLAARLVAVSILILLLSFLTSVLLVRDLAAAQRRERRLLALLEAAPQPLALADSRGQPVYENLAFRRLHAAERPGTPSAQNAPSVQDASSAQASRELWPPNAWAAVLREGTWEGERDLLDGGGQPLPIAQALTAHQAQDGTLDCVCAVTWDLTERRRFEDALDKNLFALSRRNRQVISLIECLAEGFLTLDEDWRVTLLNEAVERLLGKTRTELLGQVIWEVFPELAATPLHVYCHLVRIDEEPVEFEVGVEPLKLWLKVRAFPSTLGLSLFLTDISNRVQAEQQRDEHAIVLEAKSLWLEMQNKELETQKNQLQLMNKVLSKLATVDGLTTLKNRRTFHEGLGIEVRRARRHHSALSLLLMELDGFAQYRAEHGTAAGDAALQLLGRVVKGCLRETDLAARYGGATFALLLIEAEAVGSAVVAERLQAALAQAAWPHGALTVSIGVSVLDGSISEPDMLLTIAGDGVRRSQAAGGNCSLLGSLPSPVLADQPALLAA